MKLKLIYTLIVLSGLCVTSCRNETDMEDNPVSTKNKTIELNSMKIDSTSSATIEDETKDPPKTGQHWRQNNNKNNF